MRWKIDQLLEQLKERYSKEGIGDSWESEHPDLREALAALETRLGGRFYAVKVIGVGGSGIVVRTEDDRFRKVDKALKFPRPVRDKVRLISEMLTKEVDFLSELRHPGIVTITYHEELPGKGNYEFLPFYLMEFVEGMESPDFSRAPETSEQQFIDFLHATAEIVAYLHSRLPMPMAHLDLKPENILVDDRDSPVLIDLGTCKRVGSGDALTTTVACTYSMAHPELVRQLNKDPSDKNRARGNVSRSKIDLRWDLWSFGLSLLRWLGVNRSTGEEEDSAIYNRLSAYTRKYLVLLAARLLSDELPIWLEKSLGLRQSFVREFPIETSAQLCEVLDRLRGGHGPLNRVPELSRTAFSSIQAGPRAHVPKTDALVRVLDHRLFRRLASISQLGLVAHVFPSAKHTRREHCLGTYANLRELLRVLYRDPFSPFFRQIVTEKDCRTVLLLALLHDLGQFPLAHDLEEIDSAVFSHSELTKAMLKGRWERRRKGARKIDFPSLSDVWKAWDCEVDDLVRILDAKATKAGASPRDKLLRSLISGPIDADKLDYLFRDARHTDVPYPFGVDVDRLSRCLTTVVVPLVEGGATDVPTVAVHAKGKVAAEFLTLARYAMFSQVYWHHAVRAQKGMLFRAVEALLASFKSDEEVLAFRSDFISMVTMLPHSLFEKDLTLFPPEERPSARLHTSGGGDLPATDAAVLAWLQERLHNRHLPEAELLQGIIDRSLFKRLWVLSYEMSEKAWSKFVDVWDRLDRSKRHRVAHEIESELATYMTGRIRNVTALQAATAREKIDEYTAGRVPWLVVDVPGARPGSDVALHHVLEGQRRSLRKNDRAVGDLEASSVWELYARNLRQAAGKIRVFCRPDLVDTIEASVPWEEGIQRVQSTLERAVAGDLADD